MTSPTHKDQQESDNDIVYSIIIPAYNEELLLPRTLDALKQSMKSIPYTGEIIVVDNCSTDRTAMIAEEYGANLIFEPYRQIARARNSGARAAQGIYYIFLDADTIAPAQLLRAALDLLATRKYCGGGTLISFSSELPFLADKLVKIWNWISKSGKLAAGSFIFCLAEGFKGIGGFDESVYAGEEVFLSRSLKTWGKENNLDFTIISNQSVITSGRKFHWHSSLQLISLLILFTLFPIAYRFRSLCRFWYDRPDQ